VKVSERRSEPSGKRWKANSWIRRKNGKTGRGSSIEICRRKRGKRTSGSSITINSKNKFKG
jgi:hypothetical protein